MRREDYTKAPPGASPNKIARMITGQIALEAVTGGFRQVNKPAGLGGNNVQRVIDVLKKRDRPDSRPPAICKECFQRWAVLTPRPKLVTCRHNSVAALRQGGAWSVAAGLTRSQLAQMEARA